MSGMANMCFFLEIKRSEIKGNDSWYKKIFFIKVHTNLFFYIYALYRGMATYHKYVISIHNKNDSSQVN